MCDEVGMENIEVRKPSTSKPYTMTTEPIIKVRSGSQSQGAEYGEIYGGTLCARYGVRSQCVQYAIPLSKAIEAQAELEKDPTVGIDAQQMILSENTVIYRGEDAMPAQKSADATPTVQRDGHAFFFDLFISSLMQNTAADNGERLGLCPRKEELQEIESVPEEDCQAGRETVCNRVLELEDFLSQGELPNIKEGAQCLANPLGSYSPSMVYGQRYVDPVSCHDLLRYDPKNYREWKLESRIGYRGSFDANFGASMMSAKERIKMLAKKNRTMGLARKGLRLRGLEE